MKTLVIIACCICSAIAQSVFDIIDRGLEEGTKITDSLIETTKGLYMIEKYGRLVIANQDGSIFETVQRTQVDLPNRVFFYLYTRKNAKVPQQLYIDDVETLKNSSFDMQKETKIVTHGWLNNYKSSACVNVRNAFLQNSDCNVLVIDWGRISLNPYTWVTNRVGIVGKFAAKMVSFLESQGLNENNLTIVGHSLGAHVAGLTSYYATRKANYVVKLDPAQPNFQNVRFPSGQGKFVEVIHSNAAFWGLNTPVGDADFWPNGGWKQPGCNLDIIDVCSHLRTVNYFAESINSAKGFVAVQCRSYTDFLKGKCVNNPTAIMGGAKPNLELRGNYYLKTNDVAPFARGS